jgi:putative membrane protein
MIVPHRAHAGRMVRYVGLPVLLLVGWDVLIVVAYKVLHWEWVGTSAIPLALYGSAIGIIVGFRNNSAYSRWWEARTLWGQIVNESRSLARQVVTAPHASTEDAAELSAMQSRMVHHQIAYVHALRQQLRGLDPFEVIESMLSGEERDSLRGHGNVAVAIQRNMGDMIREMRERSWIDGLAWQAMDRNLDDLLNAQGGAERIKNTPLPKQYDFFPMLFVQIYCLLLPVGMVESLGWFTPLGSTLVGFMFLALDKIGRDLEDPFENTIYDLPLTSITTNIEINLRQLLGETKLPQPVTPVDGILW